jgi:D-tyrosyl-tRNA(Tyr) deacylase
MRIVIQRVLRAAVQVDGCVLGKIDKGLVVLIGVTITDGEEDARHLAHKTVNMRIFEDKQGRLNLSALDIEAEILVVSQFTLYADCRRGRRPSFTAAAPSNFSEALVQKYIDFLKESGLKVQSGRFGAHMLVELCNDGPVTITLDSDEK